MRPGPVLAGVGVVALSVLLVATPASADTTLADVTDVVVVHMTEANFEFGPYVPWEAEGTAVFPSVVNGGEGDSYVLQGYRPVLPAVSEDCTVEIRSFTVDLESLQLTDVDVESGFFVGVPATGIDESIAEFDGAGTVTPNTTWFSVNAVDGQVNGSLTVTLPEAITPEDVPLAFVGLFTNAGNSDPLWQVDSVSFAVSTTCPDEPVTSPGPSAGAPSGQLAATGFPVDSAALGALGLGALGLVALAFGLRARRRA